MPGIAGVIAPQERDTLPEVINGMIDKFGAREPVENLMHIDGPAGLAAVGAGTQLVQQGQILLAFTGTILPDSRIGELTPEGKYNLSQQIAGALLERYLAHGAAGLEGLNGRYVTAVWDSRRACLTIVTGRGGIEPLYYWHQGSRLVFASCLAALAAHPQFPRQVSPLAVMDLLSTGQMLDERTLYEHASALPPAARVTFQNGTLTVDSYWQPALFTPGDPAPDETEAMRGLFERVNAAVVRSLGGLAACCPNGIGSQLNSGDFCLLLTGGLDSRLLAGVVARGDGSGRACALTIGHKRARDVRYGARIARAAGIDYTVIPSNPRFLADYAVECIRRTEGGMNLHAAWILGASQFLHHNALGAVMTGVGAETISGRHWLAEQQVSGREDALRQLCEVHWDYPKAARLLRPELREALDEASRESLRRTVVAAPSDQPLAWADYVAFRQKRRHPTGNILAEDAQVLEPFFDNDLHDYAYSLPFEQRIRGRLYKKMIIEYFPALAAIGYTDSGTLLANELNGIRSPVNLKDSAVHLYYRAARRIAPRLPFLHLPVMSDNPANAFYQNTWLRTASRAFAESSIRKRDLYADILDPEEVRRIFDAHMAGRENAYRLLGAVLTFIVWREHSGA